MLPYFPLGERRLVGVVVYGSFPKHPSPTALQQHEILVPGLRVVCRFITRLQHERRDAHVVDVIKNWWMTDCYGAVCLWFDAWGLPLL